MARMPAIGLLLLMLLGVLAGPLTADESSHDQEWSGYRPTPQSAGGSFNTVGAMSDDRAAARVDEPTAPADDYLSQRLASRSARAARSFPFVASTHREPQAPATMSDATAATAGYVGGSGDKGLPLAPPPSSTDASPQRTDLAAMLPTMLGSLGIVLGLFFLVIWLVRRGMPKGLRVLPREVLEVLGRAPLAGRLQVHLVRCGNKLLLVCMQPTGAETLTEITDPMEVDRLCGLCYQGQPHSATTTFHQVLQGYDGPNPGGSNRRDERLDFNPFESLASRSTPRETRHA